MKKTLEIIKIAERILPILVFSALLLVLSTNHAEAAITLTNLTSGSSTTDTTSYTTSSISPGSNKLVLVTVGCVTQFFGDNVTPSITGNGITYREIPNATVNAGGYYISVFRGMASSPSSGAVTITFSVTQTLCSWAISEFDGVDTSGVNGSGAIVQAANQGGSSSSPSVTLSTFEDTVNNMAFGAVGSAENGSGATITVTPGSGFTEVYEVDTTQNAFLQAKVALETEMKVGQGTIGWTFSASKNWGAVGVEVRAAPEPSSQTLAISNTNTTSVTFNGRSNPNGTSATGYFRYWTSDPGSCSDSGGTRVPSSGGDSLGSGTSDTDFSENATGLTANTTYYYCAISEGGKKGYGNIVSFKTLSSGACTSVPQSGDYTVSTSCFFGGDANYDGVDGGTGTQNTAKITINSGKTLTIQEDQTIAWGTIIKPGASIVKFSGGVLKKGPLWVPDDDEDGYPATVNNSGQEFSTSQPSGYMRRGEADGIEADCDDSSAYVYRKIPDLAADTDLDGYYTGSRGTKCVGASSTNGNTAYGTLTLNKLTSGQSIANATAFTSASFAPTSNALVLAVIGSGRTVGAASSPTLSGNGLTWVLAGTSAQGFERVSIYRALGSDPEPGALTMTFPETQGVTGWSIFEFLNAKTSGSNGEDAVVQNIGQSSTGTSCTATLSSFADATHNAAVGGLVIGNFNGVVNALPGSGFTEIDDQAIFQLNAISGNVASEYRLGQDTTVDWSWTGSHPCDAVALEIAPRTITSRTYYRDSSGNYTYIKPTEAFGNE